MAIIWNRLVCHCIRHLKHLTIIDVLMGLDMHGCTIKSLVDVIVILKSTAQNN